MVIFEKIRYKNFLATGNSFIEIDLNGPKTTLFTGKNGAGKSTMIDALFFALYNTPFRSINKPLIINSINDKHCLVELEFTIGAYKYLVRRGMKPAIFEVYQNGEFINQDADAREFQSMFEISILKLAERTARQIIVLGSRSYVPFMQLKTGPRREVIDDLLEVQVLTEMAGLLSKDLSANKQAVTETNHQIQIFESKINLSEQHLRTLTQNKQALIDEKKEEIKSLRVQSEKVIADKAEQESNLEKVQYKLQDATKIRQRAQQLSVLRTQIVQKVEGLKDNQLFFEHTEECSTCKQEISHNHKNDILVAIETERQKLTDGLVRLDNEITSTNEKLVEINAQTALLNSINESIRQLKYKLDTIKEQAIVLKGAIEKLENTSTDVSDVQEQLVNWKQTLVELNEKKIELANDRRLFDTAAVLLKDSGFKTKIVRQYIPRINELVNEYLEKLGFFVSFELNESFDEVIKSRHRDNFTYNSFSEGQKARIDVSLMFTWREIAKERNSAATNLLVLDEVFDGSLDAEGRDELMAIVIELAKKESNVFVISHHVENVVDEYERIIDFQLEKNFTSMTVK